MKKAVFTLAIVLVANLGFGQDQKVHTVLNKETFYSIARLYELPPKELMKVNPKYGPEFSLKTGDKVIIHTDHSIGEPIAEKSAQTNATENNTTVAVVEQKALSKAPATHTVQKGQTLYSIARQYEMSVKELMALNTKFEPNYILKVTDVLVLGKNEGTPPIVTKSNSTAEGQTKFSVEKQNNPSPIINKKTHEVLAGQTLYSIARTYNINPKELMSLNPSLGPDFSIKVKDMLIIESDLVADNKEVMLEKKPYEKRTKTAPLPKEASTPKNDKENLLSIAKIHFVSEGQTLAYISNLYKIGISDLMKYNNQTEAFSKLKEGVNVYLSENVQEMKEIALANEAMFRSPNPLLYEDTLIPMSYFRTDSKEVNIVKSESIEKPFLKLIEYEVQKKENILDIGNRYGILITQIMELNKLPSVKLKPGQRIFINSEWINPTRAKTKTTAYPTADL